MRNKIELLKKEKNAVILAHYYSPAEVQEIADYVGDSFYLAKVAKQSDADIIVFMLGTNDSKPENWTDIEAFMEDYIALLGTYMEGEDAPKVYLGLCAEAFYTEDVDEEFGIAKYDIQPAIVDEIAETIELYALTSGFAMEVIDIHSLTEVHPEWFETDGIHPNNDGARAIAEAVAEVIR